MLEFFDCTLGRVWYLQISNSAHWPLKKHIEKAKQNFLISSQKAKLLMFPQLVMGMRYQQLVYLFLRISSDTCSSIFPKQASLVSGLN